MRVETRNHEMNKGVLTGMPYPMSACVHAQIEEQAQRTPERTALVFEDTHLSYRALNERANRLAAHLIELGVGPDRLVGVHAGRSIEMVIAALAVLKAGGAYVPLDPGDPDERIRSVIQDAGLVVILTQKALRSDFGETDAQVVFIDDVLLTDGALPRNNPPTAVSATNLACVLYTAGSTGRVMMEHGKLANFFGAMDARIDHDPPGTWLAVTSLSSDLSVLELFWTLARGFKVVIQGEVEGHFAPDRGSVTRSVSPLGFSLFMWGNDDAPARDKYRLMLESARYFDRNGFEAVWTPERHFHAFGGPYPNPSVTGAALAAVTERIGIRAGSCVSPLHHPIRIAEEWAVVDNLSNGRVALAFASGWQINDFVLRPENHANNKRVTLEQIDQVRRLWRGEKIAFRNPLGQEVAIQTLPRPVQPELPFWVTTAGNPDTYRQAGELGANVLTHLLGQSVNDVAEKITIYRQARAAAGHDPSTGRVTLMLHSFVGDDDAEVRELVRQPMKEYLRSSLKLVLEIAFPAFKRLGSTAEKPQDVDLRSLPASEIEAMLDFAFERYFETSGLFGTPSTCAHMVERCKRAGVDEIACLLDFGAPTQRVMASLPLLNEVRKQANASVTRGRRRLQQHSSIAAQIRRHGVTHLQCTPSLARMLLSDRPARAALARVRQMLVGGEALPATLARELQTVIGGELREIRRPTETSAWSATQGDGEHPRAPIYTFLAMLRERDIQVRADGDRLRCSAPAGALTSELRDELQQRKNDILKFLQSAGALARQQRAIVPLQSRGKRTPVFGVAGHNGDVFCYRALAQHLGEDQPFFGLQPPGLDGQSEPLARVEDLAEYFAAQIRAFQPNGPYIIAGYCSGGGIALELARQLLRDGAAISLLALFGSPFPTWYRLLPQLRERLAHQVKRVVRHARTMASLSSGERRLYLAEKLRNRRAQRAAEHAAMLDPVLAQRDKVGRATLAAIRRYEPNDFPGRACLFLPRKASADALFQWRSVAPCIEEYCGPDGCTGDTMLREPYAPVFADLLRQCCDRSAQ